MGVEWVFVTSFPKTKKATAVFSVCTIKIVMAVATFFLQLKLLH